MKSSLAPLKYVIGRWACPKATLVDIKKNYKSDYGTEGPKNV